MRDTPWIPLVLLLPVLLSATARAEEATTRRPGAKRIVICIDGTWNNPYRTKPRFYPDELGRPFAQRVIKPTNVLKACRAVLPTDEDGVRQITYYDIGVGGLNKYPGAYNRVLKTADSLLGGAWGAGFEARVEDAYRFLALNYDPGDEIYIFGFSRGAASARALTRFIRWTSESGAEGGLPRKRDEYWSARLFKAYSQSRGTASFLELRETIREEEEARALNRFRRWKDFAGKSDEYAARARAKGRGSIGRFPEARVRFLGVFETVLALGSRLRGSDKKKAFHLGDTPAAEVARQALAVDERRFDFRPWIWRHAGGKDLEQRWFPGVHSNIGGGYAHDGLANQALLWMMREANEQGLALDWKFLSPYVPHPKGALYDSRGLKYKVKERIAFQWWRGIRDLVRDKDGRPLDPDAAGLALDCSVLERLGANPKTGKPMEEAYGPQTPALEDYLVGCDAHDWWLHRADAGFREGVTARRGAVASSCLPVQPRVTLRKRRPHEPESRCKVVLTLRFELRGSGGVDARRVPLEFTLIQPGQQGAEPIDGRAGRRKRLPVGLWRIDLKDDAYELVTDAVELDRDLDLTLEVRLKGERPARTARRP